MTVLKQPIDIAKRLSIISKIIKTNAKMEAKTEKLQMPSTEYTWVIENFSKQTKQFCSPKFSPLNKPYNLNFYLSVHPTKKYIILKIYYVVNQYDLEMNLNYKASVINASKKNCNISELNQNVIYNLVHKKYISKNRKHYVNYNRNYVSTKLISRDDLLNPKMNYVTGDVVTFHCEIFYSINLITTPQAKLNCKNLLKISTCPESTVLINYGKLLKTGKFSDIVLVVGGQEFHVHKTIIVAQSPVFRAMFTHNTKENRECKVTITDVDQCVMKYLLDYIYTGKINLMDYCAIELLAAADKYQISHLKSVCDKGLRCNLPETNLRKIARLADMHNCAKLRDKALAKIQKKSIEDIKSMGHNLEFLLNISENIENNQLQHSNASAKGAKG